MNRHYTVNEYAKKVKLIREFYPNAAITTDIIVGYSTETDENFKETVEFCDRICFADVHCFAYSVREGTAGAKLKKLPDDIKKQRLDELLRKKEELKEKFIAQNLGKTLTLICEEEIDGYTVGYTENYLRVFVKGAVLGGKVRVKILQKHQDGALAEVLSNCQ